MILDSEVSSLLTALYSVPACTGQWDVFLAELARLMNVSKAALLAHDLESKNHRIAAWYGDTVKESVTQYEAYYWQFDVWTQRVPKSVAASTVFHGGELWPQESMQQSIFYNDFLKPFDVCEIAGLISAASPTVFESLSLYRGPRELPFDKEQLAILKMIAPHLQSAMAIQRRLTSLAGRVSHLEDAFDQLDTALVLFNTQGRPTLANRAARRVFDRQEGLSLSSVGLRVRNSLENARLGEIIARAISAGKSNNTEYGGSMLISRMNHRPLQILAAPFISGGSVVQKETGAVVFISDPERKTTLKSRILIELYGLTRAEARLALCFLDGKSLAEAAEIIGVGHETVRSQSKSILSKTGTSRQAELIRLLSALPGHNA